MTEDDALLAAILHAPDDDAPRLVYADWLDEHPYGSCDFCGGTGEATTVDAAYPDGRVDNPRPARCMVCGGEGRVESDNARRAEFIRVQCELARIDPNLGPNHRGKWAVLRRRERELLTTARDLFPPFVRVQVPTGPDGVDERGRPHFGQRTRFGIHLSGEYIFGEPARGFIERIECTAADWLAHHQALAWNPDYCEWACPSTAQPLTRVRLTTGPEVSLGPFDVRVSHRGMYLANLRGINKPTAVPNDIWLAREALCRHVWPWLTVELPPEPLEARRLPFLPNIADELLARPSSRR